MILKEFLPNPTLREFIQWYRICHFDFDGFDTIPFKAWAPKPETSLHFFLRDFWEAQKPDDDKYTHPPIVLVGQSTSLFNQLTGKSFINVQIVFQPTALFRLTGIPGQVLTDQHLDATLILGKDIEYTLERLQGVKSYDGMLDILERFSFELVLRSKKKKLPLDVVSGQMIHYGSNVSLNRLADESCLCSKQFERNFYQSVGVNPKIYTRIIRFNRASNIKNCYPERDWLSIAIECDYYDYQHLVKDYKEFTGMTPIEFHILESRSPESLLGLTHEIYQSRGRSATTFL